MEERERHIYADRLVLVCYPKDTEWVSRVRGQCATLVSDTCRMK